MKRQRVWRAPAVRPRRHCGAKRGETLTETLVGVLIVALATTILMGGVAAAGRVRQKADQARRDFSYSSKTSSDGSVTVSAGGASVAVNVTENTDGTYYWYDYRA